MASAGVVEAFDVLEDRDARVVAGDEGVSLEQLGLERGEETLGERVVVCVAAAAHTRERARLLEGLADEWVAFTERMIDPGEGDMRVGFVYKEHGGVPPFKADSEWRVTEFEPPKRMRHIGDDGSATIDLVLEVEATGGGCRLSPSMDLKPRWYMAPVMAVMWPVMMRKRAQAAMDETMGNASACSRTQRTRADQLAVQEASAHVRVSLVRFRPPPLTSSCRPTRVPRV